MEPDAITAVATEILETEGLKSPVHFVTPVSGGANNRVFKIECESGNFLLKCYFSHPDDPRNRCQADFSFTRFAWSCGVRSVPEPVGISRIHHAALYEFVVGRRITGSEITSNILNQAAGLFASINRHRTAQDAADIQPAAESCFSIAEHLACVQRRIDRLRAVNESQPLGNQASRLVHELLIPQWNRIADKISSSDSAKNPECMLGTSERCLSPSDFGFHNALLQPDGTMRFFDFEYAGWDDPAKMVCDFFCQPEVPVPTDAFMHFTEQALEPFPPPELIRERALALLPVYRIKWCCIVLNDFLGTDASRRRFALDTDSETARKKHQLAKAESMLLNIRLAE
jgi:hypothetical protein